MLDDTCSVEAGVTTEVHLASGLSLKFKTNKLCSQRLFVYLCFYSQIFYIYEQKTNWCKTPILQNLPKTRFSMIRINFV